ncbi:MAG: hypothetical protein M3P18_11205 [Actinomycetota bacterium]|nr:hypothetical protein [Actinomycetota bacterium]
MALTGLLDFTGLFALGDSDSPKPVIGTVFVLGVITLVGVVLAWRGSRAGLLVTLAVRVVDVALAVPAYFLNAPGWVLAVLTATIVATVLGIALVVPALRRSKAQLAGS